MSNDPPSSQIPPTLLAGALVESSTERALREATWPLSIGLFVLGLSSALPWERQRSLVEMALREKGLAPLLVGSVISLPLFLGARGFVAALARTAPGKLAFWPIAVLIFLIGGGLVFGASMVTLFAPHSHEKLPPEGFVVVGLAVFIALAIVRAARRDGFARWSHLQAAAAALAAQLVAIMRVSGESDFTQLAGPRLMVGTSVALLPVALWVLWQGLKKPR